MADKKAGIPIVTLPGGATANIPLPNPYDPANQGTRDGPFTNHLIASALGAPLLDITGQPLQRGYLVEDFPGGQTIEGKPAPPLDQRYLLNFHFNPDSVTETWDIDFSQDPVSLQLPTGGSIRARGVSFGWKLILDRTRFEQQVPEGVLNDSRIMAKILTAGTGGPNSAQNAIYPAQIKVVFGPGGVGTNFGQALKDPSLSKQWIRSPLSATGFIVSYDVTYVRFNKLMIPTRAEADIEMRVTYWLPSSNNTQPASTSPDATTRNKAAANYTPPGNVAWNKVPAYNRPK